MATTLLTIAGLIFGYASIWFVISLIVKRNDVADIAWGLGYALICGYLASSQPLTTVPLVVYLLVCIWALRLSLHIFLRNRGKTEDFRYRQWRQEWGSSFYWRSYLQVYLLQGLFLWVIALPVVVAGVSSAVELTLFSYLGVLFWSIGFFFQAVGDYQLARFVKTRPDKEVVLQTGLWRYSQPPPQLFRRNPDVVGNFCHNASLTPCALGCIGACNDHPSADFCVWSTDVGKTLPGKSCLCSLPKKNQCADPLVSQTKYLIESTVVSKMLSMFAQKKKLCNNGLLLLPCRSTQRNLTWQP
jgi:hypothetical protein